MASWVSQDKLPSSFKNEVQSFFPSVVIRSNIQNIKDCNKWISEFGILTNTKWNVLLTRSHGDRIAFGKYLVCHRNGSRKALPAGLSKKQSGRNTGCQVKINIKGKLDTKDTRKTDPLIKKGLIGVIKIRGKHNHSLATAEAGKFLSPKECEEMFVERFKDGMSIGESCSYHRTALQSDEKMTEADLSNNRINPSYHAVNHWFERWRKPNTFRRTTKELIEKLEGMSNSLAEKGTTIRFSEDPFALVIVTPMMKNAHELKSSGEAVFVDSTPSEDPEKHCATFMFCPCAAGAIPLAVIITKGESAEAFAKGFELLKTALDKPFHGKGGPSYFLVDESEAETKALSLVWPETKTYRCAFRFLQAVWQQLWYSKHNDIPKEHRATLMSSFQDVVYARSVAEAEIAYSNAFTVASSKIAGYQKWLKYIQDLWVKKELWCLAFRREEVRKHNENEFLDVSMKIYKDLVFSLLKAFHVLTFLEYVSSHLEKRYRSKLRDFASVGCPMLFLLSLKVKDPRLPPKEDVVEEVDQNSYLVKTKYDLFTVYTRSSCCSCRIRLRKRYCEHQYLVLENFPAVSRNFPALKPEDKEEILALAQEYAPPPIKQEESSSEDNVMVIQDVVSLAPATSSTPALPANNPPRPQPVSARGFGYYLMSVPSATLTRIPVQNEEEERKRLLTQIKKRLTENDQKYKSSLGSLETVLKCLKEVNSPESWEAFLRGTRSSGVPGLFLNGSGTWQQLPVQPAPVPLVVPTGATLRRIQPAILPVEAPATKKMRTDNTQ